MNSIKINLMFLFGLISLLFVFSCTLNEKEENFDRGLALPVNPFVDTSNIDINNNIYDYHFQGLVFAKNQLAITPNISIKSIVESFNSNYSNYTNLNID